MSDKKALGKGLEALLQVSSSDHQKLNADGDDLKVIEQDIDQLYGNPEQPRKEFDENAIDELADSIKEKGIIQPIIVEKQDDKYLIIAGERRFRAARKAGLKTVPVIERKFTHEEKLEIALIENIQRENLTPIEEAHAYKHIMEVAALSQEDVAKKVGKKRSTVANCLRLLKLPVDMQQALGVGEISAGHARAILSVVNPADQRILFNRILNDGLSVRETETQSGELNKGIRKPSSPVEEKVPKKKMPELVDLEQKFIDKLGTKVSVKGSTKKGKIEISYFSLDDLERIYALLLME